MGCTCVLLILLLAGAQHASAQLASRRTAWTSAIVDEVVSSLKALGMKLTEEQEFGIVQRLKLIISSRHSYYPSRGRGILVIGNGVQLKNAYVCLRIMREQLRSTIPVEIAYNGEEEAPAPQLRHLLEGLPDVRMVDSSAVKLPAEVFSFLHEEGQDESRKHGYSQKLFALAFVTSFTEVLLLDTDNLPLLDPEALFSIPAYKQSGNLFWPDWWTHDEDFVKMQPGLYHLLHLPVPWEEAPDGTYRGAESGQVLMDRHRHRDVLQWLWWLAANHNITDRFMHGDKDLFRVAFILAGKSQEYQQVTLPARQAVGFRVEGNTTYLEHMGMVQMTPTGSLAFHHRTAGCKYFPNCQGRLESCRVTYMTPPLSHDDAAKSIGNTGIWKPADTDTSAWETLACRAPLPTEPDDMPEQMCQYKADGRVPFFDVSKFGKAGAIIQAAHEMVEQLTTDLPSVF